MPQTSSSPLTVAVVGVGSFGVSFIPLYQAHPDVGRVVLCDTDAKRLAKVAHVFGIDQTRAGLDEVLSDPDIDAVHLITPMDLHADQSIAVLDAGKHCACAVPAGVSLDELHRLVAAQRRSGPTYMMMETAVYTREFLFTADLVDRGDLGRIQFLRGAHYSDYEAWPAWKWYPPMSYATHAVAPLLRLARTRAESVRCLGSGVMPDELRGPTGNPFPVETAIFALRESDVAAEVTRTIFRTARQVQEAFSVYGERASFEWAQLAGGEPILHRLQASVDGNDEQFRQAVLRLADDLGVDPTAFAELMTMPRFPSVEVDALTIEVDASRLPAGLRRFTGHGGSEAHLVHEFVQSMLDGRPSAVDAVVAADWTAPGLCAHESALHGGDPVAIPAFDQQE
jgi:predicted dehydrogenase